MVSETTLQAFRYSKSLSINAKLAGDLQELNQSLEAKIFERTEELNQKNNLLEKLSVTDPLTQLHNRRSLQSFAQGEISRFHRSSTPLTLALIDLDHFKSINDRFGHQTGDQVLIATAELLRANLRDIDMVARWGGEEFCVVMPDTFKEPAVSSLQRIRQLMENRMFTSSSGEKFSVTVSVGAVVIEEQSTLESLIAAADQALYRAKREGRNRVIMSEHPVTSLS